MTPLALTREEWSRALRVAAAEKDTDLGADAAFELRRMGLPPVLPRRPRRTAKRVVKPRRMP